MNSNMLKLINQLDISDKCRDELSTSKLVKIVGNKTKTNYCFYIENNNILTLNSYLEFKDSINKLYSDYKCKCKFNIQNINYDMLEDYYKYVIDYYSKESKMLDIFKDSE